MINLAFSNSLMHTKSWILVTNGFAGGPVVGKWGKILRKIFDGSSFILGLFQVAFFLGGLEP